ncbi:MAG: SIMPL domain-containing protein [candidate division Zixibacteria bacterium]|nr:SIMPL domain-containing protein [candidate division Zixibacteria bacterium]
MRRIVLVVCLSVFTSMAHADNVSQCKLNVKAQVEINAKADRAIFSFGIEGTGSTLRMAVGQAQNRISTITEGLKAIGLTESNFSTSHFRTDESIGRKAIILEKKEYKTSITITVSLDDFSLLEESILIVSDSEPDEFSGVKFILHDIEELKMTAMEKALKKARQKADLIAETMGVELEELISFTENTSIQDPQGHRGSRMPSAFNMSIDMPGAGGGGGSVFFSPQRKIVSNVEATILIKGKIKQVPESVSVSEL